MESQLVDILGNENVGAPDPPARPDSTWQAHSELHASVFTDNEAQQAQLSISFKCNSAPFEAPRQMLRMLAVRRPSCFACYAFTTAQGFLT